MTGAEALEAEIHEERAVAVLRTGRPGVALPALEAAARGGFRFLEVTLTVPDALPVIRALSARAGSAGSGDLVVGAGTVLGPSDVELAAEAGARFVVSPVVDPAVIEQALELDLLVIPGAHTPTEMLAAHRAGASLVKLFPAPASGPAYLAACLGPLPFLKVVPTHGVDAGNAGAWLAAGAWAVGFVAPLFPSAELAEERLDGIEDRARGLLAACGAPGASRP